MKKWNWTFSGPKGEHTTVVAEDERNARDIAMWARWGAPDGKIVFPRYLMKNGEYVRDNKGALILEPIQYSGLGLDLISKTEVTTKGKKK